MTEEGAENLLYRWGIWSKHSIGLGYSSENIIGRIMREGPGASHSSVDRCIAAPADIQMADSIIAQAPPHIRKAAKIRYIGGIIDTQAAKKCRCSVGEFIDRTKKMIKLIASGLD